MLSIYYKVVVLLEVTQEFRVILIHNLKITSSILYIRIYFFTFIIIIIIIIMSRPIGPALPPHLAKTVTEESSRQDELKKEEEEEEDEDESYGPSLPPELQ